MISNLNEDENALLTHIVGIGRLPAQSSEARVDVELSRNQGAAGGLQNQAGCRLQGTTSEGERSARGAGAAAF